MVVYKLLHVWKVSNLTNLFQMVMVWFQNLLPIGSSGWLNMTNLWDRDNNNLLRQHVWCFVEWTWMKRRCMVFIKRQRDRVCSKNCNVPLDMLCSVCQSVQGSLDMALKRTRNIICVHIDIQYKHAGIPILWDWNIPHWEHLNIYIRLYLYVYLHLARYIISIC